MNQERYREIVAAVDAEFERNRALYGERMRCGPGCSACCSHIFSISGIEAGEIARGLATLSPDRRAAMAARAREYRDARLLRDVRMPCPALEDGVCGLYEFRPLLCRKFGAPIYNPDKPDRLFACELNFGDGEEIRDPELIHIQTGIHESWQKLRQEEGQGARRLTVAHAILEAAVC